MNRSLSKMLCGCTTLLIGMIAVAALRAAESDDVKAQFANPPREYASGPLWVWNDMLTEAQIAGTLADLAGQKVKQVFVHPRPGLMTPYLSEDWFRLWKVALREAERLDMNIWIYDENSYPSGFAGGLLPEAMPEARGRGLHFAEVTQPGKPADDLFAVYRLTADGYENVTRQVKSGEKLPEGKYLVGTWRLAREGGWFGGKFYVDLLKPGVTEKFIEITFEAYARQVGDQFGKRLPGIFTDEPHLCPAGGLHWNAHLRDEFRKRWGYDMDDHFPALARPVGDWHRIRHNYQQVLLRQFVEHWGKPCHDWCEQNGLEFTGHYWEHGWPGTSHGPDNMAMYAWHQRPAIDCLMNQYNEGVHAQFGNLRAVKELSSVANQLGRRRTLCEAYGAGGWDLRFEDMKRIGDWLYVLGVNTLNEHLSYITIRGARKRDHPQSFSYHEPWWGDYHVMAEYFTRLSLAMSSGNEMNRVLVIEPTTTAWMYQGDPHLKAIGDDFQKLVTDLSKAQVEYDLGCEDIIARHGEAGRAWIGFLPGPSVDFIVGKRRYETVVLPPHTENVDEVTALNLRSFVKLGGRVFCCGPPPKRVDGRLDDHFQELADLPSWHEIDPQALPKRLLELSPEQGFLHIHRAENDPGILFHHRRRLDYGEILLLVNTSLDSPSSGEIVADAEGIELWDAATGEISPYPFVIEEGRLKAQFRLPACGSLLLHLSRQPLSAGVVEAPKRDTVPSIGPTEIRRLGPNVLTLDYVDVTTGGETTKDVHFYKANQRAFQTNGMERNPWDSAVQLRDGLITKTFPPDSGFEATYRFTIEGEVPEPLWIVVERPDLYSITCNGKPVAAAEGQWWLDKCFGKIDVTSAARSGENAVTIKASPMTIYHELEPAYVLGDFSLRSTDSGFVVTAGRPLELGPWNRQGLPLYAAGAGYKQTFNVPEPAGRYRVALPSWHGSVARVIVNDQPAGHIAWQPWQCDVTEFVRPGENTIEVVVIGTLKNTLGPHHAGEMRGAAWPHAFRQGPETGPPPGAKYDTIGYGLFEPFRLEQTGPTTPNGS